MPKRKRGDSNSGSRAAHALDQTQGIFSGRARRACARAFLDMRWRVKREYRELRTPAAWAPVAAAIRDHARRASNCECVLEDEGEYPCRACREAVAAIPLAIENAASHIGGRLEAALRRLRRHPDDAAAVSAAREAFTNQHTYDMRRSGMDARREAKKFCGALRAYVNDTSNTLLFWALVASLRPAKWKRAADAGCVDAAGEPVEPCLQRNPRGQTEMDRLRAHIDAEIHTGASILSEEKTNALLYFLLGNEDLLDNPPANLLPASTQWGSWDFSPADPEDSYNFVIRHRPGAGRARADSDKKEKRAAGDAVTVDLT